MGIGDFFKDVGHALSSGVDAAQSGFNAIDRLGGYNPFHIEQGSLRDPSKAGQSGVAGAFIGDQAKNLGHQVEAASQGISWLYDNGISQPISTALMAGMLPGGPLSAHNWAQAWHAANHISPGQALFLNGEQTQQAVNSPLLYAKPGEAYLPPDFDTWSEDRQQDFLQKAGMPAVGNRYVQELRQTHQYYANASGVGDFALSWWADPAIMAGKAGSAVRRERQVIRRPAAGWSSGDIDKIMDRSVMAKAQQFIWDNRDNPTLLNNLQMAKNSAMGPRFGSVAALLKSPDEVHDFLRVSLGDVDAIARLKSKNALASARLEQDTSRVATLGLMASQFDAQGTARAAQYAALARQEMTAANRRINADTDLVDGYNRILNHAHELDEVNLTRWSFARAEQRTQAQAEYRARAARGGKAGYELSHLPDWLKQRRAQAIAQGADVPFASGFVKSRIYGVGDFFSTPVTVVRSFANARPNGYMRIDDIDQDALAELRGQLARIPSITSDTRLKILNEYQATTTEHERKALLSEVGAMGAAKIAEKHGLDAQAGLEIYQEHLKRQLGEVDNMRRYSAATKPIQLEDGTTARVRVDEFAEDGGKVVVHPNLVTRLMNSHVFQDLGEMDKVLARHSSAFQAIRESRLGNPDWISDVADYATTMFKFGTLFRLGYIPRVLGDDLAGQWARAGAAAMAMRAGWGVRNGATNTAMWLRRPFDVARAETAQRGVDYAKEKIADLDKLIAAKPSAAKLQDLQGHRDFLDTYRTLQQKVVDEYGPKAARTKVIQGSQPVNLGGGVTAPAAFAGKEGDYYQKLVSSDEAIGQIFATNKRLIHGHLMRSFDHGGKSISAAQDEGLHATSWAHAINAQLAQDELAVQAIKGASTQDMAKWLSGTPEGRIYRRRLGLTKTSDEEIANSAWHEVAEYLPTPEIRAKALEEGGVTPQFLKEHIPMAQRPEVHTGQVGQAQSRFKRAMDDVISQWYKVAASVPADRMSRHPLFNQLYEGHLKTLKGQLVKQGAFDTSVEAVERMATTARRLALRDTRKLVFDIAHRSDASAALRFISPFMTATNESFQRWARIIADKPQVVGYAAKFYNAPVAAGHMQDADGNDITRDGYSYTIDPNTGRAVKRLVPKSERFIVGRAPKWLADGPIGLAFGMERSSGNFKLSQNSADLVTQGDPWFNPGTGPIVQIPVNQLVKDKPKRAELARQLGILPFGPQQGGGPANAGQFLLPSTVKNLLTAVDTSDERYQAVKLQIMQRAAYEHENLGKPMPSARQIADMTRNYWLFSTVSAALQPMATQRKDAYQFYRDQYNALRRQNPLTADDEFLSRFGESYFIFAQAQSKNESGIPATMKAVELQKKYGDLIAANPELGALIVGPEGNGPFSPEAYSYQLNTPLTPGGAEMQRTKMSADEAMMENKRRLGWSDFSKAMNGLTLQLNNRGLKSFAVKGAEDLKVQKQAYVMLYGSPTLPDGSANPFYNDAWSKDYYSLDKLKYERLIPGLEQVASSPLAAEPGRSDLRVLGQYLGFRRAVTQALAGRKAAGGSGVITAQANADLLQAWQQVVDGLIESNTSFGDLHTRYLARDLGYDGSSQEEAA